ncbi:MAG: class I mannose-6-phosphate isomerase, partial [Bacteroidales bacterium]|nr:class I mannose-6-phosphate isomerase [Bacteroidales bacterium]
EENVVPQIIKKKNTLVELVEVYMGDLVGEEVYRRFGLQFPLLFKWIDATADLSVQVHPDDELAMEREEGLGKDEMWFIRQAEMGARVVCGFKPGVNQMKYLKALKEGKIEDILHQEEANRGDLFHIPAGTVHALRAGILLAEIQQSSDTTYRIYDWNRMDSDGKPRQLHVEQALKALDFGDGPQGRKPLVEVGKMPYSRVLNTSNPMLDTPHFRVNYLPLNQGVEKDFTGTDSFVAYLCSAGGGVLKADGKAVEIKQGELVLVPACCNIVDLYPDTCGMELLETYLPE